MTKSSYCIALYLDSFLPTMVSLVSCLRDKLKKHFACGGWLDFSWPRPQRCSEEGIASSLKVSLHLPKDVQAVYVTFSSIMHLKMDNNHNGLLNAILSQQSRKANVML